MTRAETMKARYGDDYYSRISKQVKHRKGFQDRSKKEIRIAQLKGAKTKKDKHASQEEHKA